MTIGSLSSFPLSPNSEALTKIAQPLALPVRIPVRGQRSAYIPQFVSPRVLVFHLLSTVKARTTLRAQVHVCCVSASPKSHATISSASASLSGPPGSDFISAHFLSSPNSAARRSKSFAASSLLRTCSSRCLGQATSSTRFRQRLWSPCSSGARQAWHVHTEGSLSSSRWAAPWQSHQ